MIYDWYRIYNLSTFQDSGLISREITLFLEDIGEKTFMLVQGNHTSLIYEGTMLTMNLFDNNPFEFEGYAVFVDEDDDIYFGVAVEN